MNERIEVDTIITINTNLLVAIRNQGLRQFQVADRSGIGESYLSQIINGRRPASDEQKARIAAALDMRVEELFPKTEPETQTA